MNTKDHRIERAIGNIQSVLPSLLLLYFTWKREKYASDLIFLTNGIWIVYKYSWHPVYLTAIHLPTFQYRLNHSTGTKREDIWWDLYAHLEGATAYGDLALVSMITTSTENSNGTQWLHNNAVTRSILIRPMNRMISYQCSLPYDSDSIRWTSNGMGFHRV